MTDAARHERNSQRLKECHPAFAARVRIVLSRLEHRGYRPRIQEAWRSMADQQAAFDRGASKRTFGFHNVSDQHGNPESLAVDILDDDHPLNPSRAYLLSLAYECRQVGLSTGIAWGLPPRLWRAVETAISAGDVDADVKIGWDSCHVQPANMSLAQARLGLRPDELRADVFLAAARTPPTSTAWQAMREPDA